MLALATVLAGCTALQPEVDSVTLHVLTPPPPRSSASTRRDVVIEVAPPRAWPGFDTTRMAYVQGPYELGYFATNRWVDTPSRMLAPLLVHALEQTGGFRAVVQMPSNVPATYRLDTEVVRLLQDFSARPSSTQIAVRVQLTDVRTRRVVATRVFDDAEDAPSENAAGGVAAGNVALHRVLQRIADFCVAESSPR
jgi:cholesterol transport system auxiliary component